MFMNHHNYIYTHTHRVECLHSVAMVNNMATNSLTTRAGSGLKLREPSSSVRLYCLTSTSMATCLSWKQGKGVRGCSSRRWWSWWWWGKVRWIVVGWWVAVVVVGLGGKISAMVLVGCGRCEVQSMWLVYYINDIYVDDIDCVFNVYRNQYLM